MRKIATIILVTFAATAALGYMYIWQQRDVATLQRQHSALTAQADKLHSQYAAALAASQVSTTSWKRYCDPLAPFCLQYPTQWKFEGGTPDEFNYVRASITSPNGTVVSYTSPLVKDGSLQSMHVVKLVDLTVGGAKLKIIGGYPVSSGTYSPSWTVLNAESATDLAQGNVGFGQVNSRFDIGKYNAIFLSGYPAGKKFASSAEATAWFSSIDGQTALKIMESFSSK